jgi:biopolymer transport protein ExbD
MKLVSHLPQSGPALYIAPLLNTVLLLLIFFFLGSSFVVQSGVSVMLPDTASRLSGFEQAHIITVPAGPDATLYYDGREVTLAQLRQALEAERPGQKRAIIHGDVRAPYGRVMEVSSLALSLGFEIAHGTTPKDGG